MFLYCAYTFDLGIVSVFTCFPGPIPSVVLQGSLHVEEHQPAEAGWTLGTVDQVWLLLTDLWNWCSLPHAPVQQPNVGVGVALAWESLEMAFRFGVDTPFKPLEMGSFLENPRIP